MAVSIPFLAKSGALQQRSVDPMAFARRARKVLLKEIVIMAEARRRTGTHSVLQRSEVAGTTRKMYAQKKTGRARHGSAKAAIFRGGGVMHGKKPREYGYALPLKARRTALRAALRGKLADGDVRLVESFGIDKPRTKDVVAILNKFGITGTFLLVPKVHSDALWRSCRNVPGSGYRVLSDLNAYEVIRARALIFEESALKELEERYADV
ncbi:MAG: 50S ribosomal protein L4 [Planctomycetaceae bacterium]